MAKIILTEENSKPPAPSVNQLELYAKTDDNLYVQNSAGVEVQINSFAAIDTLTGDVTATGPGTATATVTGIQGHPVSSTSTPTNGELLIGNGTGYTLNNITAGTGVFVTNGSGTITISAPGASGGTVTSVALSDGSTTPIYTVSGSPVTTTGTLTLTLDSQPANNVFAGPLTSSAQPTFRPLDNSDVSTLTVSNITATTNSTLTTLSALSLPGSQVTGNISGNAANVTGVVAVANGGTSNTTAAGARGPSGLNIDERTTISAVSYAAVSTDRYIAQIGTMTAPITITLPSASSVNAGQVLIIADESGTVTSTNRIIIAANGSDTINGTATKTIKSPYGWAYLYSNGTNGWTTGVQEIGRGGTGLSTVPTDGQLLIGSTSNAGYGLSTLTAGSGISITNASSGITITNTSPSSGGTVTSVALAVPGIIYSVSGSPVTSSGTLTLNALNQNANTVLAGPTSGSPSTPTFRSLIGADFTGSFTTGSVIFAGSTGALAQDNANFFWNDTTFNLGLGTNTPASNTFIDGVNTTAAAKRIQLTGYGAGSTVGFRGRFAEGTIGTPTGALSGDILAFFSGQGYGTTGFPTASTGAINIVAAQNFTDSAMGTNINFNITRTSTNTSATVLTLQYISTTVAQLIGSSGAANGNGLSFSGGVAVTGNGGTATVTGGAAAAVAGSNGGSAILESAAGSSTGSGGSGGAVTIAASSAGGDNTVSNAGGGVGITAGNSFGSSAGGAINATAGSGGIGTATAGANGGQFNAIGGVGGAGSATSGTGGGSTIRGGAGGAGVAGGAGGQANVIGGAGGAGSASGGNGGLANITGGAAAAVAGSAGGAVSVNGAGGTSTGSGGGGGAITITAGNAGGDNTVNNAGGNITLTSGTSKGSSAGGSTTITSGVGGLGTGMAGANGGSTSINSGVGGVGSSTSGNGGATTINSGVGGGGAGGGTGGGTTITSGAGGVGTATSGAGGATSITSGQGGSSAAATGGNGGVLTISAGAGGNGSTAGGTGGALQLNAGLAGTGGTGVGGIITFRTGATTAISERMRITNAGLVGIGNASPTYLLDVLGGNIGVGTVGDGYRTKEGANAKQGTATLAAGTVTVANSSVTATSRIFLTNNASAGTPGFLYISARSAGTSFTITSSSATDTSVVAYEIFEPY